jgi:autotransporter translocation and assembly factor TamB
VNPPAEQKPWYRVLESSVKAGTPFFASLRATGHVTADRLLVRDFEANHVSANVSLDSGKLQVSKLNADFLGGTHRGEWHADFDVKPAVCSGSGSLMGISLARLADVRKDHWITGTANTSYELKGPCPADFWASANGAVQFEVRDAVLSQVVLVEDAGPLKVARFSGKARIDGDKIETKDAKLDSGNGKFVVSGAASWKQDLNLKLTAEPNASPASGFTISGDLRQPRVIRSPRPETQARLKR